MINYYEYHNISMMPRTCQIVLFSATYAERVKEFAARFAPNANQISLKQEELSVEGIKQFFMDCKSEEDKFDILVALYGLLTIGQSIIFVKVNLVTFSIIYIILIIYICTYC
jgi:ATP-dependent RNA helicase DDX19/DBP5